MSAPNKQQGQQKLIIGALLTLVAAVVLLLPNMVTEPWIAQTDIEPPQANSITDVSPSKAAEKTQYRQDSQKVLAEIIALRDKLQAQSVRLWGDFEFDQALALVQTGDDQYGYGEYRLSVESYQQSLTQPKNLQALGKAKFEQALVDGTNAIESASIGDAAIASTASELTMAIDGEDPRSINLEKRASQLPQVIEALQKGNELVAIKQLAQAKGYYQHAVSLDSQHINAAAALASVTQAITEQTFRGHMGQGFAALDNNKFSAATAAFNRASKVYPNHKAVAQALSQVETQRSQLAVNQQMKQAAEFERAEQWQKAQQVYQALLQTDPSLTQAKVKTIPVSVRASLDSQLRTTIDNPLRLSNASVYKKAQRLLADARGIANPGPLLQSQIADLDRVLKQSTTEISVVLQSDNLTDVTLFRVAKLGTFQQTQVQLRPGRYIVAGTRTGYRDVRVEFTVTGEPLDQPILVSCNESI